MIVAPTMACFAALLVASGVPRAQLVALGAGLSAMLGWFVVEALLGRRRPVSERGLFVSLFVTTLGIALGCALTGALRSPILPLLFAPVAVTFSAFGRGRRALAALIELALVLGALALIPRGQPFAPIASPYDAAMGGVAMIAALLLIHAGVTALSDAYLDAARQLDATREDVLRQAAAHQHSAELLGAHLAHEIKNPLTAVKGLVQLVERAEGDAKLRRRFAVIGEEIERMERILGDYLDFARPLGRLSAEPVELRALLEAIAALLEARAAARGVALDVLGPRCSVDADPARLREALLNLAANALEACGDGGRVTLSIAAGDEASEGHAEIVIADDGRGMSADELAQVGTPYYSTREGGTGLGIVLARAVLARHGAELSLTSEPGVGTEARVRLRAVRTRGAASAPGVASSGAEVS